MRHINLPGETHRAPHRRARYRADLRFLVGRSRQGLVTCDCSQMTAELLLTRTRVRMVSLYKIDKIIPGLPAGDHWVGRERPWSVSLPNGDSLILERSESEQWLQTCDEELVEDVFQKAEIVRVLTFGSIRHFSKVLHLWP